MIDGNKNKGHIQTCDVPQGSVLGQNRFVDYEFPARDIIRDHGLSAHFYANDTHLYHSFSPCDQAAAVEKLVECVIDVRQWMADIYL